MEREDTKERILTEALRLFSENGYAAVSVGQIAEAVGIKAPSLYKHYKSKRDIFDSILRRMEELDLEQAREHRMPEETETPCGEVPMERIRTYTKAMFLHWTEEEFPARFRKLLTLEQYRDPEMAKLYRQYLSGGPLGYMAEVFRDAAGSAEEAEGLALEFYGPMYLLYSVYDDTRDRAAALAALEAHIDRFSKRMAEK